MSLIEFLKKGEEVELTGADIINITNGAANVMKYDDLDQFDNIDQLFEKVPAVVILYEVQSSTQGHWVALIKHSSSQLEFFDSYGFAPDQEIKFSSYYLRTHKGISVPHLTALINSSNYNIIYNKVQLQSNIDHVNTCGRHASVRIKFRNMKLQDYQKLLTSNGYGNPDLWVTALTIAYSL